jgi:hypothetical protein
MKFSVLLCSLLVLVPLAASAASHLVRPDGSGDYPTIQAALDASANQDTVLLADGTFTGVGNRDLRFAGVWRVTVRSMSGDPTTCIIDCEGSAAEPHRGFTLTDGDPPQELIEGITIINGFVTTSPEYTYGGGILCDSETEIDISNCIISNCEASSGGGVWCGSLAWVDISDCLFAGNRAIDGGGLAVIWAANVEISGCTFSANVATEEGGAIGRYGGFAGSGPGVTDCTFTGNAAPSGAALYCSNVNMSLNRVIIASSTQGEAVFCGEEGHAWLYCSNVYGNAGGDWVGCIADQLGSDGNIEQDPQFCSANPDTDWNWHIQTDSPCATAVCGMMGAWPVGCGASPVERCTWGALKASFRADR